MQTHKLTDIWMCQLLIVAQQLSAAHHIAACFLTHCALKGSLRKIITLALYCFHTPFGTAVIALQQAHENKPSALSAAIIVRQDLISSLHLRTFKLQNTSPRKNALQHN